MNVFYFLFHQHNEYLNSVQQVIATNHNSAKYIMNEKYDNLWCQLFTQLELEISIKNGLYQNLTPLVPIYEKVK